MSGLSLSELETERARLLQELTRVGDFRRGSVGENYRRCGKPNCRCARKGERGHGPRYVWTRTVSGRRTRGRQLAAGEVDKVRAELAAYARFAAVVDQIVEVNEAICEARPPGSAGQTAPASTQAEKGGP